MDYSIEVRESYIYIKISGKISIKSQFSWAEIRSALVDAVNSAKENNIYKLLVDCLDFREKLSTIDRFLLAVFFVKEKSRFIVDGRPLKITFVLNKSTIDPRKFGETVARNRGLDGLVTDNMQEALKWLDVDIPPE